MPIVLKSGSLNLLEPSGPVQACNGIALPLLYPVTYDCIEMLWIYNEFQRNYYSTNATCFHKNKDKYNQRVLPTPTFVYVLAVNQIQLSLRTWPLWQQSPDLTFTYVLSVSINSSTTFRSFSASDSWRLGVSRACEWLLATLPVGLDFRVSTGDLQNPVTCSAVCNRNVKSVSLYCIYWFYAGCQIDSLLMYKACSKRDLTF